MLTALDASGLSTGRFAREYGLTSQRIYWWRSRLGGARIRQATDSPAARLLPVHVVSKPTATPVEAGLGDTLEIVLGSAVVIRVRRGFDGALLRQVVCVLEDSAC